jgi:hypothetical protein
LQTYHTHVYYKESLHIHFCNDFSGYHGFNGLPGWEKGTPGPDRIVSNDSLIIRGNYLVAIMGCDDCYSPKVIGPQGPELDMSRRLSGHPSQMPLGKISTAALQDWVLFNRSNTATVGPRGASFAANITSSETGIGNWTEEQFVRAMHEGKAKGLEGARMLLPPMPWQNLGMLLM